MPEGWLWARSQDAFQVWTDGARGTARARAVHDGIGLHRLALPVETQGLDGGVQADPVAISEAVHNGALGAVDADVPAVDTVLLDAAVKDAGHGAVDANGRIVDSRAARVTREGDVDHVWSLSGDPVEREGRDHADNALWGSHGDCHEVGRTEIGLLRKPE